MLWCVRESLPLRHEFTGQSNRLRRIKDEACYELESRAAALFHWIPSLSSFAHISQ